MLSIGLKSFFIDYYDHWFESLYYCDLVWYRRTDIPPYKREQFDLINKAGIETPSYGTAEELRSIGLPDDTYVVGYYDPKEHASGGKFKTQLGRVYYPNMECSTFVHTDGDPMSTRILHIGIRSFEMRMWSNDEWRSNTGSDIQMEFVAKDCHERHFNYPLYAIDYVGGLAVDLNLCPGIGKTPIEDHLPPREVYDLFAEWVSVHGVDVLCDQVDDTASTPVARDSNATLDRESPSVIDVSSRKD